MNLIIIPLTIVLGAIGFTGYNHLMNPTIEPDFWAFVTIEERTPIYWNLDIEQDGFLTFKNTKRLDVIEINEPETSLDTVFDLQGKDYDIMSCWYDTCSAPKGGYPHDYILQHKDRITIIIEKA